MSTKCTKEIQTLRKEMLSGYLLFAHPVVNLLSVPVEELQVHALLILLPANLPQLQQRLFLLRKDGQLQTTHR